MKVINGIDNYSSKKKSIITIGTFDGIHVGHEKVIRTLVKESLSKNLLANILTFFPHPRMVLNKDSEIKLIDTLKEKEKKLKNLGVNTLIIHPFTKEFSRMSSIEFTRDILIKKLNVNKIILGYDHRFGKNRESSVEDLIQLGIAYNFKVEVIDAKKINSINISSTKIRKAIQTGDVDKANLYLGKYFEINGNVVKGKGIGKKIGFPTANIIIKENYKLIPNKGVYLIKAKIKNRSYYGMMNIGNRPTLNGKNETLEVNIFNFNENIYGKSLSIFFLNKIRNEIKFDSIEKLSNQLQKDKDYCKVLINKF
ncbi:MAG: riboflavin biosynthesis protein RibF [Flavobacteriaceae bacterium]|nr:riboflavin biosynthesis protein RibF [Flavobacteriaceae bacterium]